MKIVKISLPNRINIKEIMVLRVSFSYFQCQDVAEKGLEAIAMEDAKTVVL